MDYSEKLLNYKNNHTKTVTDRYGNEKTVPLSQVDMAILIGCSVNSYRNWEKGLSIGEEYRKTIDDKLG